MATIAALPKTTTPTPQRAPKSPNTSTEQIAPNAAPKTKRKMGIAVAILFVLVAFTYDLLDFFTTFIGDDYFILDILFAPTTIGFWLYFRMKKINKRGILLLAYPIELIPLLDVLNLQTVYALIIIWTNMTKTGEKLAKSIPAPKTSLSTART